MAAFYFLAFTIIVANMFIFFISRSARSTASLVPAAKSALRARG